MGGESASQPSRPWLRLSKQARVNPEQPVLALADVGTGTVRVSCANGEVLGLRCESQHRAAVIDGIADGKDVDELVTSVDVLGH